MRLAQRLALESCAPTTLSPILNARRDISRSLARALQIVDRGSRSQVGRFLPDYLVAEVPTPGASVDGSFIRTLL
jgi:hypothetical protein